MSSKKTMLPTTTKSGIRLLNVNREPTRPKKRRKITITFDEAKRKEFLTGAHKRNLEKRALAKERLKERMKAEKKRITEEARVKFNSYLSQRDIPELEELLAKHEYETDGKTVSILELNVKDLTESTSWIGENKPSYEQEIPQSEDIDDAEDDENMVPGMELEEKVAKAPPQQENIDQPPISKKAFAKEIMRKTQKSKLFKRKQLNESSRNKKKAAREKKKQELMLKNARGKTKRKLERQMMKNDKKSFNKKGKK